MVKSYRRKGGAPLTTGSIMSSSITGLRIGPDMEFTVHGLDVTLGELIKVLEFSIDKEKFETMIITLRLLDKALENEFDHLSS